VIYIPIPTALRLPWIIKAIEQKKHILCEKPMGSPKAMEVIIPSCRAKGVQFMDNITFMHHNRFKDLTDKIHRKKMIGKVLKVFSYFSVPCLDNNNIRNIPDLEPLGVLGDLGIHNIRLSLWAFDYESPRYVKCICHKRNDVGAYQDISCWLFFSNDRIASFSCSYYCPLRQHAEIVGEHSSIEIRQFVYPNEKRCNYTHHIHTLNAYDTKEIVQIYEFNKETYTQETNMILRLNRIIKNKKIEPLWSQITLLTEKVLDSCRRSIDKDGGLVEFVKGQIHIPDTNLHNNQNHHQNHHNNNDNNNNNNDNRRLSIIGNDKYLSSSLYNDNY